MSLSLEPVWPWSVIGPIALGLIAFVIWTHRVQTAGMSAGRGRLLLTWKLLAIGILIFSMIRPVLQVTEKDQNQVQLLIATDVSRSMNTADGPANVTRLQAAVQDLERQSDRWQSIADRIAVRQFVFDEDLRPLTEKIQEATGEATAIGKTLESLLREARQERTIGILFLTDGSQRAVPPNDVSPLQAARKLAMEQVSVYPVGYGATALTSTTADLAVRELLIDPIVFERKLVPLKVQLQAIGARGSTARVQILIEDRTSKSPGESGELVPALGAANSKVRTEVEIRTHQLTETLDLSFIPQRPGEYKIAVEVEPLDGEILLKNNRIETIISVRQGGLRVAYFDTARPEQYFLRMVNGSDKIQLDWIEVRRGRFRNKTRIDPSLFDREAYDVFIIGDVPADVFGAQHLKRLADCLQNGAGLMMTGGLENYAAGGYGSSPLADYLPVMMAPGTATGQPDLSNQNTGPQLMVPTDVGLKRYVMQLAAPARNRAVWESLAPLMGSTKLVPKSPLVEVWAQTPDGTALLCASEVGRARVVAFGGDTTYQWVMHEKPVEHQRFWRQMILWLARKEADTDQPVWVKVEPRNFLPGATSLLEFGARSETGEPLSNVDFTVEVTGPEGEKRAVSPRKAEDASFAEYQQTQQPGDYWVRVTARQDGVQIGIDATTRFIVDPRDLELDQPNADYATLEQIAQITGGQLLRSEDIAGFVERLAKLKLEDLLRVRSIPFWDNFWLLLAFVGVMTAEWICRKRWGMA